MPLYDYQCPACDKIEKDVFRDADDPPPICCKVDMVVVWLKPPPARIFRPGWYEHLSHEPLHFDSREKLKQYVKENGMYMEAVDGH